MPLSVHANWCRLAFGSYFSLIWAFLGVTVKWAFQTFTLLVPMQASQGLISSLCGEPGTWWFAVAVSVEMNLFYAPVLMSMHRLLDNVVALKWNWRGMSIAFYTIFWFWIPAHTVTFMLPVNFQIMFAAGLSLALGVILGFAGRR